MNANSIDSQYSPAVGSSREHIESALVAAGLDLDKIQPADLVMVEDFHTMGRIATELLVELAGTRPTSKVLDAGSGIGGTARYIAERHHCHVTAVDLTDDFCETARWLNDAVGLSDRIVVQQGDVTRLPFTDGAFDIVFSQHVQMNVADKRGLYQEARRVLADGGVLALWDVVAGPADAALDFPLPWADTAQLSHVVEPPDLRAAIESSGFVIEHWNDLTDHAGPLMQAILAMPRNPLGLQAFVPDFATKAGNLTVALGDGRLRALQVIARVAATPSTLDRHDAGVRDEGDVAHPPVDRSAAR